MSATSVQDRDYAFLGAGIIAGVFVERMVRCGVPPARICVSDAVQEKAGSLAVKFGVRAADSNREAAAAGDVVFLAVPSAAVCAVVEEVRDALRPDAMLVSLAAAVRTEWIEESAGGGRKVLRLIPNTASLAGEGMNPHCLGRRIEPQDLPFVDALLALFGATARIDEELMETVTALTAVGPTFVFPVMQAMRDAAVAAGLAPELAARAAAQTVLGAARLVLETGRPPEELRQMIGAHALDEDAARALIRGAYESALAKLCQARERLAAARGSAPAKRQP